MSLKDIINAGVFEYISLLTYDKKLLKVKLGMQAD
jgi:hypothetical protein